MGSTSEQVALMGQGVQSLFRAIREKYILGNASLPEMARYLHQLHKPIYLAYVDRCRMQNVAPAFPILTVRHAAEFLHTEHGNNTIVRQRRFISMLESFIEVLSDRVVLCAEGRDAFELMDKRLTMLGQLVTQHSRSLKQHQDAILQFIKTDGDLTAGRALVGAQEETLYNIMIFRGFFESKPFLPPSGAENLRQDY
jgi:hypothetical protein